MTYVRIRSWHSIGATSRGGQVITRCGLWAIVEGTISAHPKTAIAIRPTSDTLPLDEKSCESCLRLIAHDEQAPANDPVEEEGPTEDPVDEVEAPGNVGEI